jgi:hypothetical protein
VVDEDDDSRRSRSLVVVLVVRRRRLGCVGLQPLILSPLVWCTMYNHFRTSHCQTGTHCFVTTPIRSINPPALSSDSPDHPPRPASVVFLLLSAFGQPSRALNNDGGDRRGPRRPS